MRYCIFILMCLIWWSLSSQNTTRQDTLRGSVTPERAWWDLIHYDLTVEVFPESRNIAGTNIMTYRVLKGGETELQIDLQSPMKFKSITQDGRSLTMRSEGSAHFIKLKEKQPVGSLQKIVMSFEGKPIEAKNPPWDGGFTWKRDQNNNHFIATSNQGVGSSVWWPNRDHPADEVDSLDLHVTIPKGLIDVSNGRLVSVKEQPSTRTFHWTVKNPINNYSVNLNIGDYVNFGEVYHGEQGELDMDYWVLREDEEKARKQFKQAPLMMEAFEYWFGPYPFYEDSFKLVQAPYLGMEHQSSVTYGNGFMNGYRGTDLSKTGQGLKFDFILIHESGHEWFANSITSKDIADLWIHEGFTAYSENLYLDYHFDKSSSAEYVIGTRKAITNKKPLIAPYNINRRGSDDIYYKGSNLLHTLRTIVNNDEVWRNALRGLNKEFYHKTVTSQMIESYMSKQLGLNLKPYFDQYLRATAIPIFEYKIKRKKLRYRFINVGSTFTMPLKVIINDASKWLQPTTSWQTVAIPKKTKSIHIPKDFYIGTSEL